AFPARDRRSRYTRPTDRCSLPALEPSEPLLEFHGEPGIRRDGINPLTELLREPIEPLLERPQPCVSPLRERIDELEQGPIEAPLVDRKRLDIPTHELAENAL